MVRADEVLHVLDHTAALLLRGYHETFTVTQRDDGTLEMCDAFAANAVAWDLHGALLVSADANPGLLGRMAVFEATDDWLDCIVFNWLWDQGKPEHSLRGWFTWVVATDPTQEKVHSLVQRAISDLCQRAPQAPRTPLFIEEYACPAPLSP